MHDFIFIKKDGCMTLNAISLTDKHCLINVFQSELVHSMRCVPCFLS
jgi:hypothetical protein